MSGHVGRGSWDFDDVGETIVRRGGQADVGRMSGNREPWAWCFLAVMLVTTVGLGLDEAREVVNSVRYEGAMN